MDTTRADHIISLEKLSIGHQQDNVLLSDINLSVEPGEMVALIGRNGTGKSTLLKSMIGLMPSLEGTCRLDGRSLGRYDLPARARLVSFVSSQISQLPSLTVGELVALGRLPYTGWMGRLNRTDQQMVDQALEEVQMGSFAGRKLDRLSDGERQRAMIARAFVQDTRLMVLDEPTAFLDIPNTFELIRLLSRFRDGGKSIVYSTHDLETAMQCADKMWVIHEGRIVEGAPEDLGLSGLFDELFQSSGIRYDEHSGRFLFKGARKGSVRLERREEQAYRWTVNALGRLGFSVDSKGDIQLNVEQTGTGYQWTIKKEGGSVSFSNLYNLARFLTEYR
jgi:iron complex transport system ATP-binding protein